MKKQTGYTIVELIFVIAAMGVLTALGVGAYVAAHFIAKFW